MSIFPDYEKNYSIESDGSEHEISYVPIGGLTKREWYAGLAMQGLMVKMRHENGEIENYVSEETGFAIQAFKLADAMLAESEKME